MSRKTKSDQSPSHKQTGLNRPGLQLGIGLVIVVLITIASFIVTQQIVNPDSDGLWSWVSENETQQNTLFDETAESTESGEMVQPVSDGLGLSPIARSEEEIIRQAYQLERRHQQLVSTLQSQFASEAPDLSAMESMLQATTGGIETVATVYSISLQDEAVPTLTPVSSLSQACQIGLEIVQTKRDVYPEMLPEVSNQQLATVLELSAGSAERSHRDLFEECE